MGVKSVSRLQALYKVNHSPLYLIAYCARSAGSVPADSAFSEMPACCAALLKNTFAIWLRPALWTHTNGMSLILCFHVRCHPVC